MLQTIVSMEDDLDRRWPQWKTTSMKDDINGRRHQEDNLIFEKSLMEKNLNGRQPQWKMNSMEYDLNVRKTQ